MSTAKLRTFYTPRLSRAKTIFALFATTQTWDFLALCPSDFARPSFVQNARFWLQRIAETDPQCGMLPKKMPPSK